MNYKRIIIKILKEKIYMLIIMKDILVKYNGNDEIFHTNIEVANKYNMSVQQINNILNKQTFKKITYSKLKNYVAISIILKLKRNR